MTFTENPFICREDDISYFAVPFNARVYINRFDIGAYTSPSDKGMTKGDDPSLDSLNLGMDLDRSALTTAENSISAVIYANGRHSHFVCFEWASGEHKTTNVFGYRHRMLTDGCGIGTWCVRDGIIVPENIIHPDALIILAREEELRRNSRNFSEYLNSRTGLGKI